MNQAGEAAYGPCGTKPERVYKVQRCQVHVARNVLAKVPKKFKKAVADDLRSIFYASSKKKAREFFGKFTLDFQT